MNSTAKFLALAVSVILVAGALILPLTIGDHTAFATKQKTTTKTTKLYKHVSAGSMHYNCVASYKGTAVMPVMAVMLVMAVTAAQAA